jgi:thiol:disulfide interchange protein DsbD
MKKGIVFLFLIVAALNTSAQKINPVKWTFEAVKKADKQYEIIATVVVESPWHIYSQFVKGGPIPTSIQFKKNPLITLVGKTKEEGKLEKKFDPNFKTMIATFAGTVKFKQLVSLKVSSKTKLSGTVDYTVCNDEKCLPPSKVEFEVNLQ